MRVKPGSWPLSWMVVASSLAACVDGGEAAVDTVGQEVVNGRSAFGREFDAVVLILLENPADRRFNAPTSLSFCSGTLIDATHVLTAKHCLAPTAKVVIGPQQEALVQRFFGGEEVTVDAEADDAAGTPSLFHDLGMYRLKQPVTKVTPIEVDLAPLTAADVGATATAVGYGERRRSDFLTRSAQRFKGTMRIAALEGNVYRKMFRNVGEMITELLTTHAQPLTAEERAVLRDAATELFTTEAGDLAAGEQILAVPAPSNTCYGDSGGPLLLPRGGKLKVVGVVEGGTLDVAGTAGSNRWCRRGGTFATVSGEAADFIRAFRAR